MGTFKNMLTPPNPVTTLIHDTLEDYITDDKLIRMADETTKLLCTLKNGSINVFLEENCTKKLVEISFRMGRGQSEVEMKHTTLHYIQQYYADVLFAIDKCTSSVSEKYSDKITHIIDFIEKKFIETHIEHIKFSQLYPDVCCDETKNKRRHKKESARHRLVENIKTTLENNKQKELEEFQNRQLKLYLEIERRPG